MKQIFIIAVLAATLGGCQGTNFAKLSDFVHSVESASTGSVPPASIYLARNAFDAAEASATNYLNLHKCPNQAPFCRDPKATAALVPAIRSGRVARNNATQFLKDHPNQLGTQGLYDALLSSTDTIKRILAQYGIGV